MRMHTLISQLALQWHYKTQGTTENSLNSIQAQLSVQLPDDYRELLKWSNGGTGVFPDVATRKVEINIWPAEDVVSMNGGYEIQHYLGAELIAFGDNGGDHHFLLDYRKTRNLPTVAVVAGGDLSDESIKPLANSFFEFVEKAWSGKIDESTF